MAGEVTLRITVQVECNENETDEELARKKRIEMTMEYLLSGYAKNVVNIVNTATKSTDPDVPTLDPSPDPDEPELLRKRPVDDEEEII